MKIIRYSVKKLFKTYDHEIDLSSDDQIKIILGQNGIGKTAMLKMMNAFFSYNLEEMQNYYFDLITFSFDDGTSIEISHVESDVRISMRLKTKKVYADFSQIREDSELARTKMKFILSKESYRKLEDDRWMHRVTGEILQTEDLLEMYKDVYPHLEDLNIHGYPSWLDTIVKSVHIEMIGTKRLQTVDYPEREGISRVSWRIGNTVKVYAKDFAKQLAKARAEASKVAAELDRTYPSRIISSFEKYP